MEGGQLGVARDAEATKDAARGQQAEQDHAGERSERAEAAGAREHPRELAVQRAAHSAYSTSVIRPSQSARSPPSSSGSLYPAMDHHLSRDTSDSQHGA